jgi:hypothetical protein
MSNFCAVYDQKEAKAHLQCLCRLDTFATGFFFEGGSTTSFALPFFFPEAPSAATLAAMAASIWRLSLLLMASCCPPPANAPSQTSLCKMSGIPILVRNRVGYALCPDKRTHLFLPLWIPAREQPSYGVIRIRQEPKRHLPDFFIPRKKVG